MQPTDPPLLQVYRSEAEIYGVHLGGVCHKGDGALVAVPGLGRVVRQVLHMTHQRPGIRVLEEKLKYLNK